MTWPLNKILCTLCLMIISHNLTSYDSLLCGWSVHGDALYWKALGSNVTYRANQTYEPEQIIDGKTVILKQTTENFSSSLCTSYNWGFRVGVGYEAPCNDLGAIADWTHYKSRDFNDCCSTETSSAFAHWKLKLDLVDFEVGGVCCLDECFAIRGGVGLRYARIDQHYNTNTDAHFLFVQGSQSLVRNEVTRDCECHLYNGAGPRISVDIEGFLGCGFSLWGNGAFSFLVGSSRHLVNEAANNEQQVIATPSVLENLKSQTFTRCEWRQANRPVTDLAVGLRYSPCCFSRFTLQVAAEHHCFFGQKHMQFNELVTPLRSCANTFAVYGLSICGNLAF